MTTQYLLVDAHSNGFFYRGGSRLHGKLSKNMSKLVSKFVEMLENVIAF